MAAFNPKRSFARGGRESLAERPLSTDCVEKVPDEHFGVDFAQQ